MSGRGVGDDLWGHFWRHVQYSEMRRSFDDVQSDRRLGERTVRSGMEEGVVVVVGWVSPSEGVYGRDGPWSRIRGWMEAAT